ncbi:MAG: PorV/PorQ family protein [Candidatus Zixiibacteriota bacterium]
MKKTILTIVSILVAVSFAAADEDGGYAGVFLQLPVQARPAGMGGAYIGVSDDASGQLYNPAGAAGIVSRSLTSSYRAMKLDRSLGFISVIFPTKLESSLGFSWLFAGYGEIARRNTSGQDLGTTISSSEHNFGVSFAKSFVPYFMAGTKINYYYKKVGDLSANSVGINLGAMLLVDSLFEYGTMESKPITDIRLGLVVNHFAAKYPWSNESGSLSATQDDKFPLTIGAGISARTINQKLLLAADIEKNSKQSPFFRFGGEYNLIEKLLIRTGLNNGVITAGMGYEVLFSNLRLTINYAFSDDRVDEGADHIVGFDLRF